MRGRRVTSTRIDAARNREHLLTVARAAFAADGLELPVREIARRAQVGVATVYRHFPSRQDLLAAVLTEQVVRCGAQMRAALADPDPRRALRTTVEHFADRQVQDRGLNEALFGPGSMFAAERKEHSAAFALLISRARDAGVLRAGVTVEDARVALMAITSFRAQPAAIGRLTAMLLSAILA